MSTETNANGAATGAPNGSAQPSSANPNSSTTQPPAVDPSREPENDPAWLAKRLDRERKNASKDSEEKARAKLMADLGIDDLEVVKKLAADKKRRDDEQKSLEQRVAERDRDLASREAELKSYREATKVLADEQLASLSEEQRNAVVGLAGEDPAKQLKAIATLRPTWAKPDSSQKSTNQTQQSTQANVSNGSANTVPPARPATPTAPAATAPPPTGGPPVVSNHLEIFTALNDPNLPTYAPFFSAAYGLRFGKEIAEARKARGV